MALRVRTSFTPTHDTSGIPGYQPSIDLPAPAGTVVTSPAGSRVVRISGSPPDGSATPGGAYGQSVYLFVKGIGTFFLTHLAKLFVGPGQSLEEGQPIGTLADWEAASGGVTPSHLHEGFLGGGSGVGGSSQASALGSDVPPDLAAAIQNAAKQYGVSPSVLAGIWRIESGSTYPNPAVNSSGYGGLFGTRNWNASTQAQANTAAQILAKLLREKNGNQAAALLAYSGNGYSSVPGSGGGPAPTQAAAAGSEYQTGARPGGGGGNQFASVTGVLSGAYGWANPAGVAKNVWDFVGGGGISSVTDAFKSFVSFLSAAAWLLHPKNWLRMFEALIGFGMVMYGVAYFGKGSGPDVNVGRLAGRGGGGASGLAADAADGVTEAATAAPKAVLSKTAGGKLISANLSRARAVDTRKGTGSKFRR